MLTQLRKTWPWAAGLAAFYTVVPSVWGAIARWSAPEDTTADKGVIFSCLVGLNPAVTLAFAVRGNFPWQRLYNLVVDPMLSVKVRWSLWQQFKNWRATRAS